jgi:DNA-binding FadR family transcriptional regulator
MFRRLDVPPAYKVVCDTIEREILSGRLVRGQQLPTETELAAQFGLTRHTVREGLRILEQSGLVRREAGRRLFVWPPTHRDLAPRSSRALVMQRVTFRELFEVELGLEIEGARYAAQRATPEQIARLDENLDEMARAIGGDTAMRAVGDIDIEFHNLLCEFTNNRALLLIREPISILFYQATQRLFGLRENRERAVVRTLQAHKAIIEAIRTGDASTAMTWMERHMRDFQRGYERYGIDIDAAVEFEVEPGG